MSRTILMEDDIEITQRMPELDNENGAVEAAKLCARNIIRQDAAVKRRVAKLRYSRAKPARILILVEEHQAKQAADVDNAILELYFALHISAEEERAATREMFLETLLHIYPNCNVST